MAPSWDLVNIASNIAADSIPEQAHTNDMNEATNGSTNGTATGKPHNWIPISEHVLWKPMWKVKIISIGCGFSGSHPLGRTTFRCQWLMGNYRSDNGTEDSECIQDERQSQACHVQEECEPFLPTNWGSVLTPQSAWNQGHMIRESLLECKYSESHWALKAVVDKAVTGHVWCFCDKHRASWDRLTIPSSWFR